MARRDTVPAWVTRDDPVFSKPLNGETLWSAKDKREAAKERARDARRKDSV